jgi:hypothetical protein
MLGLRCVSFTYRIRERLNEIFRTELISTDPRLNAHIHYMQLIREDIFLGKGHRAVDPSYCISQ